MSRIANSKVGLKEVAARSGLSINTVSRALRGVGYVSEKSRAKTLRAAEELGYSPNLAARSLRLGKSNEIAILSFFPNWSLNYINTGRILALSEYMRDSGYESMMYFMTEHKISKERFAEITRRQPAGAVVFGGGDAGGEYCALFDQLGIPSVGVDCNFTGAFDSVMIDRVSGVENAISHFVEKSGRENIALLTLGWDSNRLEGYRRGVRKYGLAENIIKLEKYKIEGFQEALHRTGIEAAAKIAEMDPMPDAVMAYSDYLAAGLLSGFHDLGIKVPEQVAICGFDDREIAVSTWPSLTTLAHPNQEMSEAAGKLLLDKLNGDIESNKKIIVPMKLIVREST